MPHELPERDRVRLLHIRNAAREAIQFCNARSRMDLEIDPMLRRAVVHCIQEIGEAATQLGPDARQLTPTVPWTAITRMRNRLVHVYFGIDLNIVWEVVVKDLPPLLDAVEAVTSSKD